MCITLRVPSSPITLSPSLLTASCYSEENKVVQEIYIFFCLSRNNQAVCFSHPLTPLCLNLKMALLTGTPPS